MTIVAGRAWRAMKFLAGVEEHGSPVSASAARFGALVAHLLVVSLAFADGVAGQAPIDFSGRWSVATSGGRTGEESPPGPGSGWGPTFTIVQSRDTLTVERSLYDPGDLQPPFELRYALDGSEGLNTVMMGRGFQEQHASARWEGESLVIVTRHVDPQADGGRGVVSEVRQTLSYQPSGYPAFPPQLVIETVRSGVLGGAPSTTRTIYGRR